jgi:tagatose 1,6-diphosphate aldolase
MSSLHEPFEFLDPGVLIDGELQLALKEKQPGDPVRGFVPAYEFKMVLTGTDIVAGRINLRIGNTDLIVLYAGHIGYSVEPPHRGQRFAVRATRLLLPLARRHGLETIWITVNPDNLPSRRTCEILGAEMVEIVDLPEWTDMYQRGERQKCRYRLRT